MSNERRGQTRSLPGVLAAGGVGLLAVLLYLNTLQNGFVFDDRLLIEQNRAVQGEGGLAALWLASYHAGYKGGLDTGLYRPLTLSTFRLNYLLGGLDPRGYHAGNLLLHALVSMLVFTLARRLQWSGPGALAAALLFAAHPIHTEAVANLAGRADLLSALFALLAFLAHASPGQRRGGSLLAALGWLLGLLSKESAITLLGPLLLWDWLAGPLPGAGPGERRRALALRWLPLALALAFYLLLRGMALGSLWAGPSEISRVDNPLAGQPWSVRGATAAYVTIRYWSLFCWPASLSPDYSYAAIVPLAPADPRALGALALLVTVAAAWLAVARRSRQALWAGIWYAAPYALVSNGVVLIGTIMAERLLYLPSVGLCLVAGLLASRVWRLARGRGLLALLGALVLGAAGWRTVERNRDWRDDATLFSRALEVVPSSVKVLGNLGAELLRQARVREARELLERARELAPDYAPARANLLQCLVLSGELERAEAEARAILDLEPRHALARFHLAQVLRQRGALAEAAPLLEQLLAESPDRPELLREWAWLERSRGNLEAAERAWLEALRFAPDSVMLHNDVGLFYLEQGRVEDAVRHLERAVQLEPSSVPLRNNLGRALREAGRLEASQRVLEDALRLDPRLAATHYNLALTLRAAGRLEEARRHYERAAELLGERRSLSVQPR